MNNKSKVNALILKTEQDMFKNLSFLYYNLRVVFWNNADNFYREPMPSMIERYKNVIKVVYYSSQIKENILFLQNFRDGAYIRKLHSGKDALKLIDIFIECFPLSFSFNENGLDIDSSHFSSLKDVLNIFSNYVFNQTIYYFLDNRHEAFIY